MNRDVHPEHVADRWVRAKRALKAGDQDYADRLAGMIRVHSGDRIAAISDPLEAALFSLLIELVKEEERSCNPSWNNSSGEEI
ncbi:MAG: hypothetical protein LUQ12_00825 [Methanoregulaceae archaeon]|nr:hypothetical protein [Methanoregulaceae archaeon]